MKTALSCIPFRFGAVLRGGALAGFLSGVMALGASGAELDAMPDLLGTWKGQSQVLRDAGRVVAPFQIEISRQEGELLWAWDAWHPHDPAIGGMTAELRRDLLLGSLAPDGSHGVLAKENVWFAFRLLGKDRMEVKLTSLLPDAPAGYYAVLCRGEEEEGLPAGSVPDLSGMWSGAARSPGPNGPIEDELRLDGVWQEAGLLWMDDVWHPVDPATGGPSEAEIRDRLTGGLDAVGSQGVLAKADASFSFRMLDPDRIEVEFIRLGGASENLTAVYSILQRGGGGVLPEPDGPAPDLGGAWEGSCRYPQPEGAVDSSVRIEIKRQAERLIWADNVWNPIDPITGQTGDRTWWDPMVGSLDVSGQSGVLVKPGVKFSFTLLAPDQMLLELVRIKPAGQQPMGFYVVLNRQR